MGIQVHYNKDELSKITSGKIETLTSHVRDIDDNTEHGDVTLHYTDNDGNSCFLGWLENNGSVWFDNRNINHDTVALLNKYRIKYTRSQIDSNVA